MPTELDEDAERAAARPSVGRRRVRRRLVRVQPGPAGAARRLVPGAAPARRRRSSARAAPARARSSASSWRSTGRRRGACWSTAATSRTCSLLDYREQLASVLQENFLFDGTIAENVGYARPGATLDEIKEACRIAHCDEFISQFPAGLRHDRRRARHQAVGRAAAARVDRARDSRQPAHPDPRRGDVEPRQRERADDPGRPAAAAVGPHDVRDRAPPVDDPQRRSDPRARGGRDRRARHARRAARAERPLPAAATTSSTSSRPIGSSTPARTSRRSPRSRCGAAVAMRNRDYERSCSRRIGVLRGVLGGRPKAVEARAALSHRAGRRTVLSNPTTLLTAAGVAWGIFETLQSQGSAGRRARQVQPAQPASQRRRPACRCRRCRMSARRDAFADDAHADGAAGDLGGECRRGDERAGARGDRAAGTDRRRRRRRRSASCEQPRPLAEIVPASATRRSAPRCTCWRTRSCAPTNR